jgi:putative flippase GtrA
MSAMPASLAARLAPLRPRLTVLFHETWKYFLVSALSLVVDQGVFWLLVHQAGIYYLGANVISVSVGLAVNYALSVTLVFKERRLASRRAEFVGFIAIGFMGLAVNEAFVALFVGVFGLNAIPGKLLAAGPSFLFNFITRRLLLFTARR